MNRVWCGCYMSATNVWKPMKSESTCRLCKKEAPLRKSHIIPEFLFAHMYDEKHRFHKISTSKDVKNSLLQKGIREKLLCANCEQKLSKYERYASLVFKKDSTASLRQDGKIIIVEGLDYNYFRLFALSVLWRAGVSKLDVFDQVNLGADEENLREMIFNENPGKPHEYPFILCPIIHNGDSIEDIIMQPELTELESCAAYRFVFGGIVWIYIVSNNQAPVSVTAASISESGFLTMLPRSITDMPFIVQMAKKLYKSGKVCR